jgi:hypothetical protein
MHRRCLQSIVAAAVAGGLLTCVAPAAASDLVLPGSDWAVLGLAAGALLLPSEVGLAAPTANASSANFVLGWSWQIPVTGDRGLHHRVVTTVDLLPHADSADWRGRIGYRYARRWVFGGAGVGFDGASGFLSPELGVKFAHATSDEDIDLSLHLLARAEIAPDTGHVGAVTVLFGWNIF